jgi:hypothetical protein
MASPASNSESDWLRRFGQTLLGFFLGVFLPFGEEDGEDNVGDSF